MLLFVVLLLRRHMVHFEGTSADAHLAARFLLAAGEALLEFERLTHANGRNCSRDVQQQMFDALMRHLSLFTRAGGALRPKHHLMIHCVQRMGLLGIHPP